MADKEKYFIPIEGKLIEVEKNVYVAYYKMDRRERYLEERDKDNGVVSYNTIDSQGIDGESGLQDVVTETMETIALANELRNQLHRCIAALPKAERELIHAIYFEGMTEAEYASKAKMTQSGISRRRKKTLSKLKKLLNIMLIDLTQHATRCSDSSGQAQEYLIARHAAVETETVLVQICLELGAPSVICSLKECFQITDCLVYPMQIICFVFLCVQFHTLQIQVASVTVAFYLRFRHKILVDDFLQSLSLYVIYYLHPGKQWCTVCGFGYGHHNLGLIRTTTSFAVMGRSANIAVIQLYNAGKQVFFVSLTHSGTNSIQ